MTLSSFSGPLLSPPQASSSSGFPPTYNMSLNSSSSSNFSFEPAFYHCSNSNADILFAFIVTKGILLIPLAVLIIYLGYQQWRQQHSFKAMSHSDIFTYHLTVMQLVGISGASLYMFGFALRYMVTVGASISGASLFGEVMFHLLTCVERYLAILHPITYLKLKETGGVRIRNKCIGCVWLFYLGWVGVMFYYSPNIPIIEYFCFISMSFFVASFCSISVLHALLRPGPGEVSGDRGQVDQSKKKAFHTIMAITGVLWLMFVGEVICLALGSSGLLSYSSGCFLFVCGIWLSLPSSFVLPLLFLHRGGRLKCSH